MRAGGTGEKRKLEVGIWGCGRAGKAFARALAARRGGVRLAGLLSRSRRRASALARGLAGAEAFRGPGELAARSDAVLLCVPDGALTLAAEALAASGPLRGLSVLHLSGAMDLGVLEAARKAGASVGSLHPLAPLPPGRRGAALLEGAWFAPAGRGRALAAARRIAGHLGGRLLRVPGPARPAYHLAATVIANHSTILAALALDLLKREGVDGPAVRAAFASLLQAAAWNIGEAGPRRALTGPASRGDAATLARHVELLERDPSGLERIYRLLSEAGLDLAVRRGDLPRSRAAAARRALRRGGRGR